ncbi:MAG: hypothetical protein QW825_03340 [Candidatus Bathyarchaeia archaeon]
MSGSRRERLFRRIGRYHLNVNLSAGDSMAARRGSCQNAGR